MRQKLKYVLLAVAALAVTAMGYVILTKVDAAKALEARRQSLPEFAFEDLDGRPVTRADLRPGTPAVVIHFDPDCPHCVEEVAFLLNNIDAFSATQILMVSPADGERVRAFARETGLDEIANLRVLLDDGNGFFHAFGTNATPATLFYDREFELKKEYSGKVQPRGLLKGLEAING